MKKYNYAALFSLVIVLVAFCIACTQQSKEGAAGQDAGVTDPVEGVWELTNRYWVLDDDTIYADEVGVQHKIYYDGYFMWTADPEPDSSEWHGFGTYQLSNDSLIEKLTSMSLPMKQYMGREDEAIMRVEYGPDFLKQEMEQPFRDTIYLAVEKYKRLN